MFPPQNASQKKNFWNSSNLEVYLVIFNVILKLLRISEKLFANFPHIFKNIIVDKDDIGPFMKEYVEKQWLLTQRRVLIWCFFLEKGTINTPLQLFHLELGLVCKNICRFGQYTPIKCFNTFVQSAVNARR